jgi:hypothetical protein
VTSKAAVRTPATSLSGAVPATSARQRSAMTSTGNDSKPVPVAALAERAAPPRAEELVWYLKCLKTMFKQNGLPAKPRCMY